MNGHDPAEYGRNIADEYDAIYSEAFATGEAVDQLFKLAEGGPVLELGVGTGRLAIPLAERGLEVHGVDGAEQMLHLLRDTTSGECSTQRCGVSKRRRTTSDPADGSSWKLGRRSTCHPDRA